MTTQHPIFVLQFLRKCVPFLASALLLSQFATPAQAGPGDLLVTPTRVVLEGRERSAELTLVNRGSTKTAYRITLENRRMDASGKFEKVETPQEGELFAQNLIRYAPRRVTLEPNKPQTIRVLLRKPADLSDGEYRSHLYFSARPDNAAGDSVETATSDDDSISIKLTPIYGVTIPVIVRNGTLDANVTVSEVSVFSSKEGAKGVKVTLERVGNRSVYGDITISDASNPDRIVALMRGVAVYAPNDSRTVRVPFINEASVNTGRNVLVRFTEKGKPPSPTNVETQLTLR